MFGYDCEVIVRATGRCDGYFIFHLKRKKKFSEVDTNYVSTRVSNELGAAGNPLRSKRTVFVVFNIYIFVGLTSSLVLLAIRRLIGYAYSKDIEVIAAVANMMLILIASNFLDSGIDIITFTMSECLQFTKCGFYLKITTCVIHIGITRGCGKQKIGASCSLGALTASISLLPLFLHSFCINKQWYGFDRFQHIFIQ